MSKTAERQFLDACLHRQLVRRTFSPPEDMSRTAPSLSTVCASGTPESPIARWAAPDVTNVTLVVTRAARRRRRLPERC